MENIKDKIKKLLSLAESPNENEAKAAMLKAKELMAKNKLTDTDLKKESELVHLLCDSVQWTTDSGKVWMTDVCKLIADNYLCSASWRSKKGGRTYTLMITGFRDDAELCKEVVKYAIGFMDGQIKIQQRRRRDMNPKAVASSYAQGFILGLELAFEEQKDEHPEWGLVVVKPQEVTDHEKNLGSKNVRTKKTEFDPLAYMRGQNDGKNFNAQKILAAVD